MRKLLQGAIFALLFAGTAVGQCPLTFVGSDKASIGVYVAPVDGGTPLAEYNASCLFTPASVMKSVTVAAALAKYPGNYRWQTTVMAVGPVNDGVLNGDLVIVGSGDPTLGSEYFKEGRESFINAVKNGLRQAGISSIAGKVRQQGDGWPNEGPVPSWELEDIPGIDGAGFYSLNYCDNTFTLHYPSMAVSPAVPGLNVSYTDGSESIGFKRDCGSYDLTVYGTLPKRQKSITFTCSMPNPPEVLLNALTSALPVQGREIKAASAADASTVITTYCSPELKDVARSLMVRSDNQMAEATLRLMAPKKPRRTAIAEEVKTLTACGADLQNVRIKDGSGLSRHDAISPRQLCSVLDAMASNPDYVNSFARVGMRGSTVFGFMKDMPGRENFLLKSGSMTGVVAYTGYRIDPETMKPTHVIAIMVNNAPNPAKARAAMAELLSSLPY